MAEIGQMLEKARITENGAVQIIRKLLDLKGRHTPGESSWQGVWAKRRTMPQKAVEEAGVKSAAAVADQRAGSERGPCRSDTIDLSLYCLKQFSRRNKSLQKESIAFYPSRPVIASG